MRNNHFEPRFFAVRAADNDALKPALAGLDVTWMIFPQSVLTFSPVPHDVYVLDVSAGWRQIGGIYDWMRAREPGTPAVFVCESGALDGIGEKIRLDPSAYLSIGESPATLRGRLDNLAARIKSRVLLARSEEMLVAGEALAAALSDIPARESATRHRLARARELLIRAKVLPMFKAHGGTAAQFERLWPAVFEEVLADRC